MTTTTTRTLTVRYFGKLHEAPIVGTWKNRNVVAVTTPSTGEQWLVVRKYRDGRLNGRRLRADELEGKFTPTTTRGLRMAQAQLHRAAQWLQAEADTLYQLSAKRRDDGDMEASRACSHMCNKRMAAAEGYRHVARIMASPIDLVW